ncbi:MAG: MFS transporter, partial [Myxococcales bacterium]|nr:MFS transporter [Myxococcales bacterium]
MSPPAAAEQQARDLRAITADGVFFSTMVGLGETYVPAFALAVGLGEVVAGLIATLPMLVGALFQLVTPWAVRKLRSYRRWIVACACLQAVSFLPLIVGAALGQIALGWLAIATVAYWSFGMATSPAWNAWVTSLVPAEIRAHFFAGRTRVAQAALFGAILLGGITLHWGRIGDAQLVFFALLFAAAMVSRFVSASFL